MIPLPNLEQNLVRLTPRNSISMPESDVPTKRNVCLQRIAIVVTVIGLSLLIFNLTWALIITSTGTLSCLYLRKIDSPCFWKDNMIPLHYAAFYERKSEVKWLLMLGANPNQKNSAGLTPVHHSAYGENEEILQQLIQAGGNLNASTNSGSTPLDEALFNPYNMSRRIGFLLDQGADPRFLSTERRQTYNRWLAHLAAGYNWSPWMDMV